MVRWLFPVLTCLLAVSSVNAADIRRLETDRDEDDNYRLALDLRLTGTAAAVWDLLNDFANWHRLSPVVEESEVLAGEPQGRISVRTRMQGCVLLFCKTIHHVQTLRQVENLVLEADTDPARSDFSFGRASWRLTQEPDATRLLFSFEFRPAFWVPPLVGSWLIERGLRNMALATAEGLEEKLQAAPQ